MHLLPSRHFWQDFDVGHFITKPNPTPYWSPLHAKNANNKLINEVPDCSGEMAQRAERGRNCRCGKKDPVAFLQLSGRGSYHGRCCVPLICSRTRIVFTPGGSGSVQKRVVPQSTVWSLFLPDLLVWVIFILPLTAEIVCKKYIRKSAVGSAVSYYVEC